MNIETAILELTLRGYIIRQWGDHQFWAIIVRCNADKAWCLTNATGVPMWYSRSVDNPEWPIALPTVQKYILAGMLYEH